MMKADPIGLYVHIPFCLKKCNYCDFCSFADIDEAAREKYISALVKEIRGYAKFPSIDIDTIFFGGGTPSLLTYDELALIYDAICESFHISPDTEFTVEVNPKTVTEKKMNGFASLGVNRVSVGLQTIHENERKILGRVHNYEDFKSAIKIVRKCGIENISVDVMYGIPEQTKESFYETLCAVTDISPTHISAYGLILEEGTPFWDLKDSLNLPDEDTEYDMYRLAVEFLRDKGYSHYEISNYAKDGFESKHNLKYWNSMEYIGVGVAAYSYYNGFRYGNTRNLSEYLSYNAKEYISREAVDISTRAYEYVMLGLRLRCGISLSKYKSAFGVDFMSGREDVIRKYIDYGYMEKNNDTLSLTDEGFYISNTILTDLL